MKKSDSKLSLTTFSSVALPHLERILTANIEVMQRVVDKLIQDVEQKRSLFVFGSGHSALLTMEIYHRAGGPSFVIPIVADYLLPTAGPPVVRFLERTPGSATMLLNRAEPQEGEMIWLVSQSGINPAVVDIALEAKRRKLFTVAFTSVAHSRAVSSRHPSQQKLFEVCDEVVDWGGVIGDASLPVNAQVSTGPLSTLSGVFLAHSILTTVIAHLEEKGIRCAYTSVNTPPGEIRNRELEEVAKIRDPLLR